MPTGDRDNQRWFLRITPVIIFFQKPTPKSSLDKTIMVVEYRDVFTNLQLWVFCLTRYNYHRVKLYYLPTLVREKFQVQLEIRVYLKSLKVATVKDKINNSTMGPVAMH